MSKILPKKLIGAGHRAPLGTYKAGVGTFHGALDGIKSVVAGVAHPKKGGKK